MEILGIGAPELVFVIVIALIVLGPKDMQKAGRSIGRWLNQVVQSDGWKAFQQTSRELRNLPNNLMREANMELAETERELRKATDFTLAPPPPASPPSRSPVEEPPEPENSIQPPAAAIPPVEPEVSTETPAGDQSKSDVNTTDQDA